MATVEDWRLALMAKVSKMVHPEDVTKRTRHQSYHGISRIRVTILAQHSELFTGLLILILETFSIPF